MNSSNYKNFIKLVYWTSNKVIVLHHPDYEMISCNDDLFNLSFSRSYLLDSLLNEIIIRHITYYAKKF